MKIDTSTGAITGNLALGSANDGPFTVTILAGDGTFSTSQTFTINVNRVVSFAPIAAQTIYELDMIPTLPINAADASLGTLTYSAIGLPAGLKIDTSTGDITGTVANNASANGPYFVTVTASDGT